MNKKIVSLVLAISMCVSMFCSVSVNASSGTDNIDNILSILSEFKILQGDSDGNYRLDDTITRAEFTKVAVAASSYRNSVPSGISVSPFPDVPYYLWSAPFIKVALSNKVVSGYTDGTFRPSQNVTYEEGLTIMLKLLGYTVADFGSSWPSGQIGLAQNIELTKNVNKSQGQNLSRRDVAYLAYNLLNTKPKNGNAKYISTFEWSIVDNATLISKGSDDNSILTSEGTYKATSDFESSAIGREGTLFLNKNGKAAYFIVDDGEPAGERYVVYSVLNDAVIIYDKGNLSQLKLSSDTTTYLDSAKSTYSAAKAKMSIGDVINVKRDKSDKIEYISVETQQLDGPVKVVKSDNWYTSFDINSLSGVTVVRDSSKVTENDLQTNDIAYYSKELNMIFAYSKKITGVYENAKPNRDTPTSVTISGIDYNIESVAAYNQLSSTGNFKYGDTVTLLLGKDGDVADVATLAQSGMTSVYGYLTSTGTTEKDINDDGNKTTVYTATVVNSDGTSGTYTVNKDSSSMKNSVVRITFSGGVGTLSKVNNNSNVFGKVDADGKRLGDSKLSSNVKILDVASTDSKDYTLYTTVYLQRMDDLYINPDDVLYYEKNSSDEIDVLYLKDVTGDMYEYGIVTSSPAMNSGTGMFGYRIGSYTGSWNQTTKVYSMSSDILTTGAGARFAAKTAPDGSVATVMSGESLFVVRSVKDINEEYLISTDSVKYLISSDVTVYKKNANNDFMQIKLSDILNDDSLNIRAYYDATTADGGRVRVIVVE